MFLSYTQKKTPEYLHIDCVLLLCILLISPVQMRMNYICYTHHNLTANNNQRDENSKKRVEKKKIEIPPFPHHQNHFTHSVSN